MLWLMGESPLSSSDIKHLSTFCDGTLTHLVLHTSIHRGTFLDTSLHHQLTTKLTTIQKNI